MPQALPIPKMLITLYSLLTQMTGTGHLLTSMTLHENNVWMEVSMGNKMVTSEIHARFVKILIISRAFR